MIRDQAQVQKVLSSCSISVHEAQALLSKFLKDHKKFSQDLTSYYEKNENGEDTEEEVLGFGQEDDEIGKTEEIERRLKGILNSLSGHEHSSSKRSNNFSAVHVRIDTTDSPSDSMSQIMQNNSSEVTKSKKELKALEKEKRKAEEKEKKRAEKEAKKAAKARKKAEKKSVKAEKKAAKKRKHSDISS